MPDGDDINVDGFFGALSLPLLLTRWCYDAGYT